MSPYDAAHQLARALAECREYRAFLAARERVEQDEVNRRMLADFQELQAGLQMDALLGREPEAARVEQAERLHRLLSLHPVLSEYLQAEFFFTRLMADVQKIIAEAVPGWLQAAGRGKTGGAAERQGD